MRNSALSLEYSDRSLEHGQVGLKAYEELEFGVMGWEAFIYHGASCIEHQNVLGHLPIWSQHHHA